MTATESSENSPPPDVGYLIDNDDLIRLGHGSLEKGRARVRLLLSDARDRAPINGPVDRPANVRLATIRDEPALLDLMLEDLNDNAVHVAPTHIPQIMQHIQRGTRGQGGYLPVVDGDGGEPVAAGLFLLTPWWWSDWCYLQDIFFYNSPAGKRPHAGNDLMKFGCWLADQLTRESGRRVFAFGGVTATQRRDAKSRMLARSMNIIGTVGIYPAVEKPV